MSTVDLDEMSAQCTKQGSLVRQLKKDGAASDDLASAVEKLKALKAALEKATKAQGSNGPQFNRKSFDDVLVRKFFVIPSFEIHGGVAGLFDLGPPGCALKANILQTWRQHFILTESMLEMDCTNMTPEVVLKTSGHVDRFSDYMVKDILTGECLRADKLLEDAVDQAIVANPTMGQEEKDAHYLIQRQADSYPVEELGALLKKYNVKSSAGNELGEPFPFNLMFKTTIGPEGHSVGYLRPETAQGLFVNFKRLIDYNAQKMPFAGAQIGLGFRNEISPQGGLLRVREFCMAEIEHFVNPNEKDHPSFVNVEKKLMVLFGNDDQLGSGKTQKITIGEAVR
jgi:glycyl-tRNA synthetase